MKRIGLKRLLLTLCIMLVLAAGSFAVVQAKFIFPIGLVSYWSFDDRPGVVANDEIASNHGEILGGAERVKGLVKKARFFDGVDDYLVVQDHASLDMTGNEITIEMWVYPESVSNENILVRKGPGGCGNYSLFIREAQLALISGDSCHWDNRGQNSIVEVGSWQHIAVTYDGLNIRYYIDGNLTDTVARDGVGPANASQFSFGGPDIPSFHSDRHFRGMIDELALYSEALDAAEIELHYLKGLENKPYFHVDANDD